MVFNALGTPVYRKEHVTGPENISLKTKGFYFLRISNGKRTITKKIIVK